MRNWSTAAVAALLVAGCNSGEKDGNGGNAANAAASASGNASGTQTGAANSTAPLPAGDPSAQSIQPGEWEMTSEMLSVEAPGAPPQMTAQLRAQLPNQRQTRRQCITAAEAANVGRNLMGRDATAQGCRFSDTTFAGGVIRIAINCRQPGGQSAMQMAVDGSFSGTQLNAALRMSMTGPAQGSNGVRAVNMTGRMSGRRIGECPARGATPQVSPAPTAPPTPRP